MSYNERIEKKLSELCTITSSKRIYRKEYEKSGIPFYRSKEVIQKHKNEPIDLELFISEERYHEIKTQFGVPEKGDILLTSVGTLGIPYYIDNEDEFYFKDGNLTWFKHFSNEIHSKYLYYYILSPIGKEKIDQITIGSTQKAITIQGLKNVKIKIPTKNEQVLITKILSSLDDKIELNNKINKNLEELAQTLYKHWFVDFEFPNEEGLPYKSSGGKMIESELGLIPENWTIQYLNEVLEFERGIEPGSKNYEETYKEHLVPFYRVGDMINQDKVVYVDKELTNNKIANVGDVFVSFDGALGRISNTLNGSYSTGIRKVFSKEKFLSNNFIYVLFQSADIQNTIKMYASGTTILHASSSIQYLSMPFNKDIVDKFTETISPIVDKIITNKIENIKLAEMRDLLLPKLMSGEIRLPIEE